MKLLVNEIVRKMKLCWNAIPRNDYLVITIIFVIFKKILTKIKILP